MHEIFEPWTDLSMVEPSERQMWMLGVSYQDLIYRDALMQSTSHIIGAALRTPPGSGYYERLDRPYIGEMVMEYGRGWWSSNIQVRAWSFGVLVAARKEHSTQHDRSGYRPAVTAHYVRWGRSKDDVQRWEDSKFVLVPVERDTFGP